jgi:hypothetical protein
MLWWTNKWKQNDIFKNKLTYNDTCTTAYETSNYQRHIRLYILWHLYITEFSTYRTRLVTLLARRSRRLLQSGINVILVLLEERQQSRLVDNFSAFELGKITPQNEAELERVEKWNPVQDESDEVLQHADETIHNYMQRMESTISQLEIPRILLTPINKPKSDFIGVIVLETLDGHVERIDEGSKMANHVSTESSEQHDEQESSDPDDDVLKVDFCLLFEHISDRLQGRHLLHLLTDIIQVLIHSGHL